jgi:hypothetical protein
MAWSPSRHRTALAVALAVGGAVALATPTHALAVVYQANLNGMNESPPNVSPGSGTAFLSVDEILNTMRLQVSFSGLTGNTTAAHIHGPTATPGTGTAGVMTTLPSFAGFPLGVTSGIYDSIFGLLSSSTYNPSFVTNQGSVANARNTLLASLTSGSAYLNVHSSAIPGGEIRGFFQVPAPLPILGAAAGMSWCRRLRRRVKAAV